MFLCGHHGMVECSFVSFELRLSCACASHLGYYDWSIRCAFTGVRSLAWFIVSMPCLVDVPPHHRHRRCRRVPGLPVRTPWRASGGSVRIVEFSTDENLSLSPLTAISGVDGRYEKKTKDLRPCVLEI